MNFHFVREVDYLRAWRQYRGIGVKEHRSVLRRCLKIPTAHPCIQLCPGSVNRPHPVMQVPVNGHLLPLFPPLDRRHVAVEVCGDFLPRIQPVFRWTHRWRRARGWFTHRALLLGPRLSRARGAELYPRLTGPTTAKHGIRRQVEKWVAIQPIAV